MYSFVLLFSHFDSGVPLLAEFVAERPTFLLRQAALPLCRQVRLLVGGASVDAESVVRVGGHSATTGNSNISRTSPSDLAEKKNVPLPYLAG